MEEEIEFYYFDNRFIDDRIAYGFIYANENTFDSTEIFVEFTDEQKKAASDMQVRWSEERIKFLKSIVKSEHEDVIFEALDDDGKPIAL